MYFPPVLAGHIGICCIYPITNWEPVNGNTPLGGSLGPRMGLRFIFADLARARWPIRGLWKG